MKDKTENRIMSLLIWLFLALTVLNVVDNRNRIVELKKKIEILEKEKMK